MSRSNFATRCKQVLLAALCVSGAALGTAAYADSRNDGRGGHHNEKRWHDDDSDRGRHDRRSYREDERHRSRHGHRYDGRRHYDRYDHRYARRDWHYHGGRYWAPPRYRGRYCDDHRHYRGAHYHVASHDYYEYYYPRYRPIYHGPRDANATVIITLPLF